MQQDRFLSEIQQVEAEERERQAAIRMAQNPDSFLQSVEEQLKNEILKALTSSRFLKVNLAQIARWHGVNLDIVEQLAQHLSVKHLGYDIERLEFNSVVKQIHQLETNELDAGMREWKLQALARRCKRTRRDLMEIYNKALCQQQPVEPLHVSKFKEQHQKDIDWLIQGWIPKGVTLLLHADGGVGKTLFVYQILESILEGKPWNGYQCDQGEALLVQCDEPELITAERLDIRGIPDDAPLYILTDWQVEAIAKLDAYIEKTKPALLVIDSVTAINRNTIFSENDTEYARPILQIRDLARRHGTTVIIIHHSNASGESRGTRAIHNSVDEVWGMSLADGQQRLLRVQKTRLGRPPGRYKFAFEDDFSFRYIGEDGGEESFESDVTQEERIRLWLSEDDRIGIGFAPVEVSEELGIGREQTRRALYELWGKGLIQRRRPKNSPYYLYFVKKKQESDRSESEAIGSYTPLKQPTGTASSSKAIGRSPDRLNHTNANHDGNRSPDRLSATDQSEQGIEPCVTSDRPPEPAPKTPELIENVKAIAPGDFVLITGDANWIRAGSDRLPWQKVPKGYRSSPTIPVNVLELALFQELKDGGKVLELSRDGERVRVRNQETGRTSVFPAKDVRVLSKAGGSE